MKSDHDNYTSIFEIEIGNKRAQPRLLTLEEIVRLKYSRIDYYKFPRVLRIAQKLDRGEWVAWLDLMDLKYHTKISLDCFSRWRTKLYGYS